MFAFKFTNQESLEYLKLNYPHVTFEKDGIEVSGSGRKTPVFLKTNEGWKIIHEHGEMRQQD